MIKFGPSGNSQSFYDQGYEKTEDAALWVKQRGLNAYEYSFGRGVRLSAAKALSISSKMQECGVELSVHAPYYVNFANLDDEMAEKSYGYILDCARIMRPLMSKRCVFHSATQGKLPRGEAFKLTSDRLKILRDKLYEGGFDDLYFCPETMGKLVQIGDMAEVTELCKIDRIFLPCVDFGHINARENGGLKTKEDCKRIIDIMIDGLGFDRVKNFHAHFSKIMYTQKGEVKHLTFEDTVYGPEFAPLAEVIADYGLEPYIICESAGTQGEDAAAMKEIYDSFKEIKLCR